MPPLSHFNDNFDQEFDRAARLARAFVVAQLLALFVVLALIVSVVGHYVFGWWT